ncbi:MAG: AMP-binding protein [Candidatus Cryptobacteroides sp.]|nr:AMP-binding protein [Rikenellaceae bacterium]MDY5747142.1 AMP-binding protein [Candidatus Cryptobacteroides sp.]
MKPSFNTLAEVYDYSTAKFAKKVASEFVGGEQRYTFAQFKEKADNLSRVLSNFGIGSTEKVAILSENMPNWTVAFFAITAFGRIAVPMLPELSHDEVENILTHSDSKAIFISRKQLPKLDPLMIDRLNLVIDIDDFSFIKSDGKTYTCDGKVGSPTSMDTAAIIYTSGTTGKAKGVMLSHRNFCTNIMSSWYSHKIGKRDVMLSILPMAHTYEMSIGMLYPFATGARVCYIQKVPTPSVLIAALKEVRPTAMLSVPLIIEKIYKSSVLPTIRKSSFLLALKKNFPWLLYKLVGMKLMKTFGGRIRFFGIGGAKLDRNVEKFLKRAGFPYAIGYGLTETAPLICAASPKKTRVGSTGRALPGVEVKLDNVNPETGEGELIVKGPNVMLGYYKDYERTLPVLGLDGWFRTGDLASVDKKGRYYIKGRMGSLILGSSGENIYPEEIEAVINSFEGVGESLVVQRDGKLVALVQMNDNILNWNLEGEDKFVKDLEELQKSIKEFVNARVSKFSNIRQVEIQREPFVKTATHKIKRFLYEKDKNKEKEQKD